jgi:NADH-quinone oxidoreductase subunit F
VEPILTRNVDKEGSETLAVYRKSGGYAPLAKALAMDPDAVTEEVKASGLRGRGGAGFPAGVKWSFMPKDDGRPHYLVNNADESEPGTFKDRLLLERDPHMVIEGSLIAAYAIRAEICFIYLRGEYGEPRRVMERAIAEAYEANLAGKNILGKGFDCEVVLHVGAGAYICGEETALMDSLEGGRGNPRLKPPFPAQRGVYDMPTTINNVETLANVPHIIERGADWYKSIGTDERNTGPKLYSLSGHVKRPGNYELPIGVPLMELIEEHGGGMLRPDRPLKAVIPGGSSVPVLRADECRDALMDYDNLAAKGSMLGSAGCMVMDESTCMVRAMERIAHFYAHESCGQCTPCREGCGWLEKIIARIERGEGRLEDLDLLLSIAGNMQGTTICPLSDAAAMPCESFVTKFRDEFEYHVKNAACLVA